MTDVVIMLINLATLVGVAFVLTKDGITPSEETAQ